VVAIKIIKTRIRGKEEEEEEEDEDILLPWSQELAGTVRKEASPA
jgi:hypothetical protein